MSEIIKQINENITDHVRIDHLIVSDVLKHLETIDKPNDVFVISEIVKQIDELFGDHIEIVLKLIELSLVRDMIDHIISQDEIDLNIFLINDMIEIILIRDEFDHVRSENEFDVSHDDVFSKKCFVCCLIDMLIIIDFLIMSTNFKIYF
jgi:hypothetical protein